MNPKAGEWKPSIAAPAWSPTSFSVAPPQPAPAPAPAPPADEPEEEIDENDPLWQAVLKIAEGDRAKAMTLIGDPDSLMTYPEVAAILESSEPMETEQETAVEELVEQVEDMKIDEPLAPAVAEPSPPPAPAPALAEADEAEEEIIPVENLPEGDPREHLNLVFIGHVDAGKSTLSGNILYITENVDKRTIERYEKEAKERNRDSWFLAFIMDTNEEERAKGKTVEVGRAHFETEAKRYTIMDAPGHKNYVPNMIMGASQADIGILVISARKGEFEAGFDRGGQSREHAMLAKTLGVAYLVVAINKMDEPTVQWSKDRFDECVSKLRPFLRSCGFTIKTEVKFIPISGLGGANVKDEVDPKVCPWWKKCCATNENNTSTPTLIGLLDSVEIKGRNAQAPLRIPVLDRYIDRGTIAMGKVESGVVRVGQKVIVMPTRNVYKVDGVWANESPVAAARPGENVLVKLAGAGVEDIRKGFVMCSAPACRAVSKIIAQIALVDMPESTRILTAGFQAMFHAHTAEEECTIVKIFETTNKKGVTLKDARFAGIGMKVVCLIEVARTVSLENYADYPFLGRFTLRTDGKTIAIGKITKLPPKKE
ncbi:Elongation factor Tu C-terminal domain [Fragilaria crotonensis]|nr:Elongation factor Tu C-terminal domain [Fragilaria crotonensis]